MKFVESTKYMFLKICTSMINTMVGKNLSRENFGEFEEWCSIRQNFLANTYKYNEITEDLPVDSPKFSTPFFQNFHPQNYQPLFVCNACVMHV